MNIHGNLISYAFYTKEQCEKCSPIDIKLAQKPVAGFLGLNSKTILKNRKDYC